MSIKGKIYLLCIDAFPEITQLKDIMIQYGLKRSELVCSGAFTLATFTSMISGSLGTEVINGGIGYETLYKPSFYTWRKQNCIIERLVDNNYDVFIHNHVPWFSKVVGGKQLTDDEQKKHYREHTMDKLNDDIKILPFGVIKKDKSTNVTYSSTNPELTLNTFLKWNFPNDKNKFYENESNFIKYIQNIPFDGLFISDLCHWHEYVYYRSGQIKSDQEIRKEDALNDTINWLKNWDFNEPNSIFFIFADHSHRVNPYLDPQSHITWVYFKDNMQNKELNPLVSSTDFYKIVEQKFGLLSLNRSIWSKDPFSTYDPSRIYAIEDSRSNSQKKDCANAFGRCCLFNDVFISLIKLTDATRYPAGIYLIICNLYNKYTFTAYVFDNLDNNYVDSFSVICNGPLDEYASLKNNHIFKLNDDIISKAKELYLYL